MLERSEASQSRKMIEILRFAQKRSSIPKGAKVKDLLIRLTQVILADFSVCLTY